MTLDEWIARVERRETRVGIVGMGYVGLPLALEFCRAGFAVVGFDIDAGKIAKLNRGESYIFRIGAEEIEEARAAGFTATGDFSRVLDVDAVLICVPTPLKEDTHEPDMSFVEGTIAAITPYLQDGQMVVLESTTYPGTTEEIVVSGIERSGRRVLRNGERVLEGVLVVFSPEREDPGSDEVDRRDIPKVVGGVGHDATEAARALYGAVFHRTVAVSSPRAAEMTKLLENIYRCVNIALVNEMKMLCGQMGIDVWEVIDAAKTKPFGFQAFYPGPGVGGHCIPVDPFYLSWKAGQMGAEARFIELAGEVNEAMPLVVVEAVESSLRGSVGRNGASNGNGHFANGNGARTLGLNGNGHHAHSNGNGNGHSNGVATALLEEPPAGLSNGLPSGLLGASVLVLGVAYKRDVDDLRESPSLVVIELLKRAGARVEYNDPFFPEVGHGRRYALNLRSTPLDDLERFDCVVILTDHSVYDYKDIVARAKRVVDSRNATRGIESEKIVRC